ncbi:hypothetical protein [Flavobacterium sp. LM4]|uniref:hypothetical protein n=1 Tax=Flavobacterium sp. LM4 TaxID=1938609 RepID=UPI001670A45D|nr:hypothetical protein [Flavobacterium sp. LM4]
MEQSNYFISQKSIFLSESQSFLNFIRDRVISALHIAALVKAGKPELAREKLFLLTDLIKKSRNKNLDYGFNEWYKAQDGDPMGQDWQSWSAALYLYAAECVRTNTTPFFEF